jgi:hypothetical protein
VVAFLSLADGEPFATGKAAYAYGPVSEREQSSRISITIEFEGLRSQAVLDTAAPYVVCAPSIAEAVGLDPANAIEPVHLLFRGIAWRGLLHRVTLDFIAEEGLSLRVSATAFVPDMTAGESWRDLPSFIGMGGCLERMRFGVDPGSDTFYFGPLS